MAWRFSIGNLISRAPAVGAVAGGGSIDPLYPLDEIGNGYPDSPSRWAYASGGVYSATFDLNLLATSSDRTDAPTGWADLFLKLANTPGISINPPDFGTYAGRADTLRFFRPMFQDIEVMPGESVTFRGGIYRPAASNATAVRVMVVDLGTGKQWDGAGNAWSDTLPLAEQSTDDTWLDVEEVVVAAATERTTYRVILYPVGADGGATFYAYCSTPSLCASQDMVAIVGHNIPEGATVTWSDGTVTATMDANQPSFFESFTASTRRTWTLSVTIPAALRPVTQATFVGELWAGTLRDMEGCPGYPFDIVEGEIGQTRLEGGLGREMVFSQQKRPTRAFKMKFRTTSDDQFEEARDEFFRATRYGADPLLLAPVDIIEGQDVIWHGRLGPETTFSRVSLGRRQFDANLRESPFPRL